MTSTFNTHSINQLYLFPGCEILKSLIALLILYAGFAAAFLLNGFLARHLSLSGFGDLHVGISAANILAAIAILGGHQAARRLVPRYMQRGQWGFALGFLRFQIRSIIVHSLAFITISLGLFGLFLLLDRPHLVHEAALAISLTPLLALTWLLSCSLQARHRPFAALVPVQIFRPVLVWAGCVLILAEFESLGIYQAILLLIAASLLTIAVQAVLLVASLPFPIHNTPSQDDRDEWRRIGLALFLSSFANSFLVRINVLLLEGLQNNEAAVGAFSLLLFLASVIWLAYQAVTNVIGPAIAEQREDLPRLQLLYNRAVCFMIAANIFVATPILLFSEPLLAWFHEDLLPYRTWMMILVTGACFTSTLEIAAPFLNLGGQQNQTARLALVLLLLNLVLTSSAILAFGLGGAVCALLAVRLIRGAGYLMLLHQRLNILPWRFYQIRTQPVSSTPTY